MKKDKAVRRNQVFPRKFDSTLGYPGEGPARKAALRTGRYDRRRRLPRVKRGTERVLARRTQLERVFARKGIVLRHGALKPSTKAMYQEAFRAMWRWVGRPAPKRIESTTAYDALLGEYICQAWEHGLTRGQAGNALSASVAAYPELRGRGKLTESWYLLNCWSRLEVPCRAPPIPALVVVAMAQWMIEQGHADAAFLLGAGFDGFLRTRELLSLTWADVQLDSSDKGVISLAHTKIGQRTASFEACVMNDPMVGKLFRLARSRRTPGTSEDFYIFAGSEARFYSLFQAAIEELDLSSFGFRPYSLRRGGATAYFRATGNMPATIERGRWATLRVARIYINDGLAKEVDLRFSEALTTALTQRGSILAALVRLQ